MRGVPIQYELYEKGKVIMLYEITESWTGRFKVYEIGHTEGDRDWLATFRKRLDAERFVKLFATVGNDATHKVSVTVGKDADKSK